MKPKFCNLAAAFAPLSRTSLIVVASVCAAASVNAAQTWTGATDAIWTTATNWTTATPGSSDLAIFDATSTANLATTLGADTSVLGLKVVDPTAAVSIAVGNTLTVGASGIDLSAATQNLTVNAPLALSSNQSWNIASGRTLTSPGGISGAFSLTKSGAGGLTLGNTANTFSGGATVSEGTITIGSGTSASAGNLGVAGSTITLAGGTITNGTGGSNGAIGLNYNFVVNANSTINMGNRCGIGGGATARTVTGSAKLTINAGTTVSRDELTANFNSYAGTLSFGGSGNLRPTFVNGGFGGMTAAAVEINGTASLTPVGNSTGNTIGMGSLTGSAPAGIGAPSSGGTPTYSIGALGTSTTYDGGIIGSNNIIKTGSGTLTLTNATALTYTGTTTVNGGTLKINGTKSGAGTTTVNSGYTLAGTGSVAGTTTITNGGILSPGDGGVGNLTFSSLTLNTGSTIKLGATPSTNRAIVQGTLTLQAGINVDVNGYDTDGTYTIMDITGATLSGSASTSFVVTNGSGSKIYTFASTGSAIQMTITSSDPSNFWNLDGSGTWNTAGNWTKGTIPNIAGAIAKIGPGQGGVGGSFSTDPTITLDADQTVGLLVFNDDFGPITLNPGTTTPGTLFLDNGSLTSEIVDGAGSHVINAPVSVDAQGVSIDVGSIGAINYSVTINGVVSGASAALTKTGSGKLILTGNNTYSGGTVFGAGVINVNSATSLGAASATATFMGGIFQLANDLTSDTRPFSASGANNVMIDTNGFNYTYGGTISTVSGGTGGLQKLSLGTMTINTVQTYTGPTIVGKPATTDNTVSPPVTTTYSGGVLEVPAGGVINGGATTINTGSSKLLVSGGSYTSSGTSSVVGASTGIAVSSGSATFGAINANTSNASSNIFINLTGGTFSSGNLTMGRCVNAILAPTAGSATAGLYINGSTATLTGTLTMGNGSNSNSSVSTRIDSGSLTVSGTTLLQVNSPDRWAVFDVNGGTFTSNDAVTGIQLGSGQVGNTAFLVRAGVATVERIYLTQAAASTKTSLLHVSGGALYIGAGGIVGNNNAGTGVLDIQLGAVSPATTTLGAKADWTTSMGATLVAGTVTTISAADATNVAHNITISGILTGSGDLQKTGTGILTLGGANTYTGAVAVNAGTLAITGDSSAATGAVSIASAATLSGNGNIGGNVTIASGAHHSLAIGATPATQTTRVISGTLTMDSGNILDLTAAAAPVGGTYVLATVTGGITGTIATTTINYPSGVTGTVAINGNNLELTVVAAGYTTWATANAGGQAANLDYDNDGVANGVEYFMGQTGSTFTANPGLVSGTVTWPNGGNISSSAYGTEFLVQTSTNLVIWTNVLAGDTHLSNTAGSVSYTLPTGLSKTFVRLVVTPN